jgi:GNAT superfamily N-acetyltransferase
MTDESHGRIRAAENADIPMLNDIAFRSKAHWGYSDEFMAASRPLLTLTPAMLMMQPVFLALVDDQIAGFYALRRWHYEPHEDGAAELDYLFIAPEYMGLGVGRALFGHAVKVARAMGYRTLIIIADPNAEAFYAKMGAVTYHGMPSDIQAGRVLPLMRYSLADETP